MANILIIDDDEHLRKVLVQVLQQDLHRVSVALDGHASLHHFQLSSFDLIFTGIVMVREAGLAIIRAIAKAGGGVPVIALTGGHGLMSSEENVEAAALMGIKVTPIRHLVRADLRQAIAAALS